MGNRKILKYGVVVILALAVFSFIRVPLPQPQVGEPARENKVSAYLNGQLIIVEVADQPAERERGLSGRPGLGPNEGMLFVFEAPGFYKFWMKDMNFPIDIIWLDQDIVIIEITKGAEPTSFPAIFTSGQPAQFVLEVPAGFSEANNLSLGQRLSIDLE